ncbi:MAG TPA: hypothetical protein ACFCUD_08650 [Cyclobacteriaceae bacterium]
MEPLVTQTHECLQAKKVKQLISILETLSTNYQVDQFTKAFYNKYNYSFTNWAMKNLGREEYGKIYSTLTHNK